MSAQLELPGFDNVTRFVLEGVSYSAQRRKCGKPECRCNSGDPADLHGPYWYGRGSDGINRYYGRSLPSGVVRAWSFLQSSRLSIQRVKDDLSERMEVLSFQMEALRGLSVGYALSSAQCEVIESLGFSDCLVSVVRDRITQEKGGGS